jgi:hypothetical protein
VGLVGLLTCGFSLTYLEAHDKIDIVHIYLVCQNITNEYSLYLKVTFLSTIGQK